MESRRLAGALVAFVVALSLQGISVAKPASPGNTHQSITPPYSEAVASPPSDACGGNVFGDPQCAASADASTNGSVAVETAISGTSRALSFTASGFTRADAIIRQYINNPKKNGAALTARLKVQVPEAVASATPGDHAEVFLDAFLSTSCFDTAPTDCYDYDKVVVADSSGASACRPECIISLAIKAPANMPLGSGRIEFRLVSHAELFNRSVVLPTNTRADGRARALLQSIELLRS